MTSLAADLVVLLHFGFILFVVAGAVIVARWPRAASLHIPCVLWGAWIELSGRICPLTPLENRLRVAAGGQGYQGGFIERYILPVIYPVGLTPSVQVALGVAVLTLNLVIYGALIHRRSRRARQFTVPPSGTRPSRVSSPTRIALPPEASTESYPAKMRPVFIGGCPRSGTTVLGSMLGSHSRCLAVPESQFIIDLLRRPDPDGFDPLKVGKRLTEHFRFKTWAVDIAPPNPTEASSIGSYPDLIEWFVSRYGAEVGRPDRDVWVEHSPLNVQYAQTLFDLFPDARLIHIVRDGRAVAASVMRLEWGPNETYLAAPWWAHRLAFGLAAESHFGPERVMRVRYEDLIVDPQGTLKKICAFVDLDFEEAMMAADGLRVPDYTTQWHELVGSRPDPRRIEAWRNDLEPRQIEIFESITRELLTYLGYELDLGLEARPISSREKIVPFLREHLLRRRVNGLRRKKVERRTEKQFAAREKLPPSAHPRQEQP